MLSADLRANSCNSFDVLCRKFANQVPGLLEKLRHWQIVGWRGKSVGLRFAAKGKTLPDWAGAKVSTPRLHGMAWHGMA